MNSESVDLIATDPPFNKGRDFHATPDSLAAGAKFQDRWSWEKDVHQEWVDQLKDDHPRLMEAIESAQHAHSEGMGAYLCFMAVRLLEMQRVLKPTGSIYLHCDATASHYLKAAMDAVFGHKNFLGDIIWNKQNGVKSRSRWSNENDNILCYAVKYRKHVFNHTDAACRKPFSDLSLKMHFKHTDSDGRKFRKRTVNGKGYLYYADEGRFIGNLWDDIPSMKANTPILKEGVGYPTQKPLKLYERIIKASTNKGDIVLDPFAGCATTCVAAERLERQWVGIDIWDKAEEILMRRMDQAGMLVEGQQLHEGWLFSEDILFTRHLPERTDDKKEAAPFLRVKECVKEPDGKRWSREKMYEYLLQQHGYRCQGCDREFDDPRYLQLDHNTPRSDGGLNHITNRVLLCGPCNQLKSNIYTLSGLRRENKKRGYMASN